MKITDKERLDWLLDNRDLGVRGDTGNCLWFDTRKQIDAAIRQQKPARRIR